MRTKNTFKLMKIKCELVITKVMGMQFDAQLLKRHEYNLEANNYTLGKLPRLRMLHVRRMGHT